MSLFFLRELDASYPNPPYASQATNMTFGSDTKHFTSSRHRSMGLALFLLVFFQVAFGSWVRHVSSFPAVPLSLSPARPQIHWTPKHSQPRFAFKHKTYQNWLHSTVGVAILVLGWSTCFAGFNGRSPALPSRSPSPCV